MRIPVALVIAASLGGCVSGPAGLLAEASNTTSQVICSGVFVSGLDADKVYRAQLHPEAGMAAIDWALRYHVDRAHGEVNTRLAGAFPSQSVYRDGRGCTLTHGGPAPQAVRVSPPDPPIAPDIAGAAIVTPANAALGAAIDEAFRDRGNRTPRGTAAVVVVQNGRVIGERYAPGLGVESVFDGHSLAKSVVNALVGDLVRLGRLDVHSQLTAKASTAGDARAQVTLENLMRMNAGFDFDEGRGPGAATRMWYLEADSAHFASGRPLTAPVGEQWRYSNVSYALISRLLGETVGGPQALSDFARRELFDPLGMRHVTIEFDGVGTLMGANGVFASARDWARFGMLYLNDGRIGSRRILPEGWVKWSTTATPGSGYGAGFWLNTTNAPIPAWGSPWGLPGAPTDAFMGRGYLGQWLVIVPSADLIIVRMGVSHADAGEMTSTARLVRDVVRALPSGR